MFLTRRPVVLALAVLLASPAVFAKPPVAPVPPSSAQDLDARPDSARVGPWLQAVVIDKTDQHLLPLYWHFDEAYVVANPGHQYSLRLTNQTSRRVMAVVAVDGVNTLTGETAGYEQAGYVLEPYQTQDIEGWYHSSSQISPFVFVHERKGHAARTGRGDNQGVVGVAVFEEEASVQADHQQAYRDDVFTHGDAKADPNRSFEGPWVDGPTRQRLAPTYMTDFRRASWYPSQVVAIHYDQVGNLMRRGIVPNNRHGNAASNPFPRPFVPSAPSSWE